MSDRTRDKIEQVRQMALNDDDYKTALSCTMSKSKLLGGGLGLERRQKERDDPIMKLLSM